MLVLFCTYGTCIMCALLFMMYIGLPRCSLLYSCLRCIFVASDEREVVGCRRLCLGWKNNETLAVLAIHMSMGIKFIQNTYILRTYLVLLLFSHYGVNVCGGTVDGFSDDKCLRRICALQSILFCLYQRAGQLGTMRSCFDVWVGH